MTRHFDGIFRDGEIYFIGFLIPLHFIRNDGNKKSLIPKNTIENVNVNPLGKGRVLVWNFTVKIRANVA